MAARISDKAAIVGIGATEFSKDSGRSELALAAEAVKKALDDAGLKPADVDGMVTFTIDQNEEVDVARAVGCGPVVIVEGDSDPATEALAVASCADAEDGDPCKVCDLVGMCVSGECQQLQLGPPYCD